MLRYFSKFWLDFVLVMTQKEIKARYKRVFFGFLWAFLNPVLQMLVIGFVFQYFIPTNIENYFYFLFAGLLPWNFFSSTITTTTPIFFNERSLIQKAKFPREALVLSIVLSNFFHFVISVFIFLLIVLAMDFISLIQILILISAIFWLLLLVTGCSFLLSVLFVKYRDIKFFVSAIIPLWFYATPVIYKRELLPEFVSGLLKFNPMTGIVELSQYAFILDVNKIYFVDLLPGLLVSAFIFIFGMGLFIRENRFFDDWL